MTSERDSASAEDAVRYAFAEPNGAHCCNRYNPETSARILARAATWYDAEIDVDAKAAEILIKLNGIEIKPRETP